MVVKFTARITPTVTRYRLVGKIVPKARPRFSDGHAYLPERYRDWKDGAIAQIIDQSPPIIQPINRCTVQIEIYGKGQRGDLDNLAGAVLDALVQAMVIVDDSIGHVAGLNVLHLPTKGQAETIVTITVLD